MSDSPEPNPGPPPLPTPPKRYVDVAKEKWQAATTPVKAGIAGGAAVGCFFLVLFCCAFPAALLYTFTGGAEKKLVGNWEGTHKMFGQEFKVTVEFKKNGRFSAVDGLGETWTGTWKVKLVEGKDYHLNLVYDSEPDRVKGWTVHFKDDDTITLDGFTGVSPTLKRK